MNCENGNKKDKPKDTEKYTHIWSNINNPNLYCWIPIEKSKAIDTINEEDVNIQDIPPPNKSIIEMYTKIAQNKIYNRRLQELKQKKDLFSVNDPQKLKIVENFIKANKLLLYGGSAINLLLPEEHQFYNNAEDIDYDIYSPTPWKHALKLGELLYNSGYKYITIRSAIHPGTYKVNADMWDIADITYLSKEVFDTVKYKVIKNIRIISPEYLIASSYKELSQPYIDISRWPKIFSRLLLLRKYSDKTRKVKCKHKDKSPPKQVNNLLTLSNEFIIKKELILSGNQAYNIYMALGGSNKRVSIKYCEALSENAHSDIQELFSILLHQITDKKSLFIKTTVSFYDIISPTKYTIFYQDSKKNNNEICSINQIQDCIPYKEVKEIRVISVDYLFQILYYKLSFLTGKEEKRIACMIQKLHKLRYNFFKKKNISEFDQSPFQKLVVECIGPIQSKIKHKILERWRGTKVNHDCEKIPIDKCIYPCTITNNKCVQIPDNPIKMGGK